MFYSLLPLLGSSRVALSSSYIYSVLNGSATLTVASVGDFGYRFSLDVGGPDGVAQPALPCEIIDPRVDNSAPIEVKSSSNGEVTISGDPGTIKFNPDSGSFQFLNSDGKQLASSDSLVSYSPASKSVAGEAKVLPSVTSEDECRALCMSDTTCWVPYWTSGKAEVEDIVEKRHPHGEEIRSLLLSGQMNNDFTLTCIHIPRADG